MSIRDRITKEKHAELIKAVNLLCEFIDAHLPPAWEIENARQLPSANLV